MYGPSLLQRKRKKYAEGILHGKRAECKKKEIFPYKTTTVSKNKKKAAELTAALWVCSFEKGLELYNVSSLISLGSLGDLERHPLTFVKSLESVTLDGAVMDENVPAIVAGEKSVALCRVEPLNCSLGCQICSS
jgi:hypothetical protein